MSVLATKLFLPPCRPDRVARPRLLERLESSLHQGRRLTLVTAPPGYGKTTLIAEWAHRLKKAQPPVGVAWLSLDSADNDPARFFTYLAAAFQKEAPGMGAGLISLLGGLQLPPAETLLTALLNDLSDAGRDFLLVLDDLHKLTSPLLYEVLQLWVEGPVSPLHIALLTREDPPLALGRLRARNGLTELRAADLRFTPPEAALFLEQTMGLKLNAEDAGVLSARTEGWPAGLQMAGLSLQGREHWQEFLDTFSGSHQYVMDYLMEEVLQQQTPARRAFLRQTAVLDRFCAELADALLDPDVDCVPAAQRMAELQRANLFLLPLDDQRRWFRYHHLFADFLRLELSREQQADLHRRAAAWFAQHNLLPEAIQHALQAGEEALAAQWIAQAARDWMNAGEVFTLMRWIEALPQARVLADPNLVVYQGLCLLLTGQTERSRPWMSRLQTLPLEDWPSTALGKLFALQAWGAMMTGGEGLLPLTQAALARLDAGEPFFLAVVLIAQGTAYQWAGDLEQAAQAFERGEQVGQQLEHPFASLVALANRAYTLYEQGRMLEAIGLCQQAGRRYVDGRGRPLPIVGLVDIPLATFLWEQGHLEQAQEHAQRGLDLIHKLFSSPMFGGDGEQVLIQVAFAQGRTQEALDLLAATRRYGQERRLTFLIYKMGLLEAWLKLQQGQPQAAAQVLQHLQTAEGIPAADRSIQAMTARLALHQGRPADALEILNELGANGRSGFPSIRLLQALAYEALGQTEAARASLQAAIETTAAQEQRTVFWREGGKMRQLLEKHRDLSPHWVAELLAQFPAAFAEEERPAPVQTGLIDPLSEQEINVLRLMAAGHSNQEIAEALYISVGTAKWHVHNILNKLGVARRSQAMALARQLNLV